MNANPQSECDESLTAFGKQLTLAAPKPHAGFEQALGRQFKQVFVQRIHAKQPLIAIQPQNLTKRIIAILIAILIVGIGVVIERLL